MCMYRNMKHILKYYKFYKDFGHSTTECFHLRKKIEFLVLSEYLKEFVAYVRQVRKSMELDKGKHVPNTSLECEAP